MQRQYLKVKDIADMLAFTERHVRQLIADGEIPAVRINKSYRVDEAVLEEYLCKSQVTAE